MSALEINKRTNNIADYKAVILGLRKLRVLGIKNMHSQERL
jgi:ribonuclease HI